MHKGDTHDTTSFARQVYQRDVISPRNAEIRVVYEGPAPDEDSEVLRFELADLFYPEDGDFLRQVLFGVNILQESVGCADIFSATATADEILSYRMVNWVIFPPGTSDNEYRRVFQRMPRLSEGSRRVILERRAYLEVLNPRELVFGQAFGASTYFGAVFRDDLVVFENVEHGNAIYVMFEDWATLSRLSRTELLRNYTNYLRIAHTNGWMERVRTIVDRLR